MTDLAQPVVRSPKRAEAWARKAFRLAGSVIGVAVLPVRPIDGVTDDAPRLNAIFRGVAGLGVTVLMLPGVGGQHFQIKSKQLLPNAPLHIVVDAAQIDERLVNDGDAKTAAFAASRVLGALLTTLAAPVVVGSPIIQVNAALAVGQQIALTPAGGQQESNFTVVATPGTSPTLDRPVLLPYRTNDLVTAVVSLPTDLWIEGMNGAQINGITGVRAIEIQGGLRPKVWGLNIVSSALSDALIGMDLGARDGEVSRCDLNGGGTATTGIIFEHTESCIGWHSPAYNMITAAHYLNSAVGNTSLLNCDGYDAPLGVLVTNDAPIVLPCQSATVRGGQFSNLSTAVFEVAGGAVDSSFSHFQANDCAAGLLISSLAGYGTRVSSGSFLNCGVAATVPAGVSGTVLEDIDCSGCLDFLHAASDVLCTNIRGTGLGVGTAWFSLTNGADVTAQNVNLIGTAGTTINAVLTSGTVRFVFDGLELQLPINSNGIVPNSAGTTGAISNTTITPLGGAAGTTGLFVNAGTLRIGANVDVDACAVPFSVTAGFINRKNNIGAAGTGAAQPFAWPDLKSTDQIMTERVVAGGTATAGGPLIVQTPGVGWTNTFAAGDTGGYTQAVV